jgi:hypothetical protein
MALPGFTAEATLEDAIYPAACKCDWWEWGLDPAGCAARAIYCKDPHLPPTEACHTDSHCLGFAFVLICRDVCTNLGTGQTYVKRDWYTCGPCFGLW